VADTVIVIGNVAAGAYVDATKARTRHEDEGEGILSGFAAGHSSKLQ
jgi:hypothetical protein